MYIYIHVHIHTTLTHMPVSSELSFLLPKEHTQLQQQTERARTHNIHVQVHARTMYIHVQVHARTMYIHVHLYMHVQCIYMYICTCTYTCISSISACKHCNYNI